MLKPDVNFFTSPAKLKTAAIEIQGMQLTGRRKPPEPNPPLPIDQARRVVQEFDNKDFVQPAEPENCLSLWIIGLPILSMNNYGV